MKVYNRIKLGMMFLSLGMGFILVGLSGCNDTAFSRSPASETSLAQTQANMDMDNHREDTSHDESQDCTAPSGNQVMICHVPPGNPAARHTICVGVNGAQNGHGINLSDPSAIGGHGGDTLGACGAVVPEPVPSSDPSPQPSSEPSPEPSPEPSSIPEFD